MKRFLSLLAALLMLCSFALAESSENYIVATVNGEYLLYSEYTAIESVYLSQYEAAGMDLTDDAAYAYVQDLALTYAIEQMLVEQDMRAQGCYDFDEETEAWLVETGTAAYAAALVDVAEMMRDYLGLSEEEDVTSYALSYANSLGVTVDTYIDFYRDQYAMEVYRQWLIGDKPITDADVEDAYASRVEESKALYENDAAAFETALSSGTEAWYKPAGYRSVLQILLTAEGDTDDAKLASVQATVDEIYSRLEKGETFQSLIAEYGTDANFQDESFLASGYQVHKDSIMWDDRFVAAAFSAEMAQPGSWSQPIVSDLGVHILYYLCDSASGPIELTDELRDALSYYIYTERYTAAETLRINELAAAAEVVFN